MTRAFPITQESKSVMGRGDGMSATTRYTREVPTRGAIWFWLGAILMSWGLLGCLAAVIWWGVS